MTYQQGYDLLRGKPAVPVKQHHEKPNADLKAALLVAATSRTRITVIDHHTGSQIYSGTLNSRPVERSYAFSYPLEGREVPISVRNATYDRETQTLRVGVSQ